MIDVLNESLIDLKEAAKSPAFRTNGQKPHTSAVYRWVSIGARGANGERTRLETVRTPSGLRTSSEAITRFIQRLTDPDAPIPTPKRRQNEIDAAERELAAAGMI